MKRIITAALALLITATLLTSCSGGKDILKSSKKELSSVGEISGEQIPMELYRYVAMNHKKALDTGESGIWTGDSGAELLADLNSRTEQTLISLYTVLAAAKEYGIDPDSEDILFQLDTDMEATYATYEHDYKAYNSDLSLNYMNDSVLRFLYRNDILSSRILGKMKESGLICRYDDAFADVASGDVFARVKLLLVSPGEGETDAECQERAKTLLAKLDKGADFDSLIGEYGEDLFMFNNPDGYYISRGSYYEAFEDAAFSLEEGEYSGIIKTPAGYGIVKRYPKEQEYITDHLPELYETYCDGIFNETLSSYSEGLTVSWNDSRSDYTVFNMEKID